MSQVHAPKSELEPQLSPIDQLIAADDIGHDFKAIQAIEKQYGPLLGKVHHVQRAIRELPEQDYEVVNLFLDELESKSEEEQVTDLHDVAVFLGTDPEDTKSWFNLRVEKRKAQEAVHGTDEEWAETMATTRIQPVDLATFPESVDEPILMYVGGNWCLPCHVIRSTFAKALPPLNTKNTPIYYTQDDELRKQFGFNVVPQLALFTPEGNIITASAGQSTKELVDNVTGLLAVDETEVTKDSTLVCEDGVCRVK